MFIFNRNKMDNLIKQNAIYKFKMKQSSKRLCPKCYSKFLDLHFYDRFNYKSHSKFTDISYYCNKCKYCKRNVNQK